MLTYEAFIDGTLPGMNEYVGICRTNRFGAGKFKHDVDARCIKSFCMIPPNKLKTVFIKILWIEKDRRRDKDNIASAKKFIFDALVKAKILPNDGWKNIVGFTDDFIVDPKHPGVRILLEVRNML